LEVIYLTFTFNIKVSMYNLNLYLLKTATVEGSNSDAYGVIVIYNS